MQHIFTAIVFPQQCVYISNCTNLIDFPFGKLMKIIDRLFFIFILHWSIIYLSINICLFVCLLILLVIHSSFSIQIAPYLVCRKHLSLRNINFSTVIAINSEIWLISLQICLSTRTKHKHIAIASTN